MTQAALVVGMADTHHGRDGAIPHGPDPWLLPRRNPIYPNTEQLLLWDHWCDTASTVAALRKKLRARLIIFHAGDAIEGDHHSTTALMTHNIRIQSRMHEAAMRKWLDMAGFTKRRDTLLYCNGTPAHSGAGGDSEEGAARALEDYALDGRAVDPVLDFSVNGVAFNVKHQGDYAPGRREHTYANGAALFLRDEEARSYRVQRRMARVYVRAHYHQPLRALHVERETGRILAEACLLPCWALPDDYSERFTRDAFSAIGLFVWEISALGEVRFHPLTMQVQRRETVEL